MLDSYCEELLEHVKELASKQNGKNPNEAELKIIFEEKWIEWMQEFTVRLPKVYQHNVDIDTSFERCLRDLLQKHDQQIIEELSHRPLREWGKTLHLAVQADKHLQSCRWYSSQTLGIKDIKVGDTEYAQRKTDSFLQAVNKYLLDLIKRRIQNFDDAFIYGLFNIVLEAVNQCNQEMNGFKFTEAFKVDSALTVGGYALRFFEEMLKVSRKENDPIEYPKTLKVVLFKIFKSRYQQANTYTY